LLTLLAINQWHITGVTTTQLASRMRLAEVSGAAHHLQKVLLQIDEKYYFQ
jgi:hypothetical protein